MRRRDFLSTLCGAGALWPLASGAQQQVAPPVIGYLDSSGIRSWFEAFEQGLRDLGHLPGQTVSVAWRSAAGQADRLPAIAAELLRLEPRVMVASGSSAVIAAGKLTHTVPVVFAYATDPVALGLVATLARPGGNITGQSNQAPGLVGKRLQLLAELVPGASHFGVVWAPSFAASHADFREMQAAARELGLTLASFEVAISDDFDAAFRDAASRTKGVVVLSGPLIFAQRDRVVATAARYGAPAIYYDAEYVEAGGLASYGASVADLHRSAAVYVDKILKGARPADLPVAQPTRFRLVINLKAAQALGFRIPPAILARADAVIE